MHDHFAERIAVCKERRDKAQAQLDRIAEGWRFETFLGSRRFDVTDDIAERENRAVEELTRQIESYEARDA